MSTALSTECIEIETNSVSSSLTRAEQSCFHYRCAPAPTQRNTLNPRCSVCVSVYARSRPTYYDARTHTPKKQAMLALHTPRPTTHTECLWEHLWCERWRTNSPGWVWFFLSSSPLPLPQTDTHRPGSITHPLPLSLCCSVVFSRTMNIPPTLAIWGSYRSWSQVASVVSGG